MYFVGKSHNFCSYEIHLRWLHWLKRLRRNSKNTRPEFLCNFTAVNFHSICSVEWLKGQKWADWLTTVICENYLENESSHYQILRIIQFDENTIKGQVIVLWRSKAVSALTREQFSRFHEYGWESRWFFHVSCGSRVSTSSRTFNKFVFRVQSPSLCMSFVPHDIHGKCSS